MPAAGFRVAFFRQIPANRSAAKYRLATGPGAGVGARWRRFLRRCCRAWNGRRCCRRRCLNAAQAGADTSHAALFRQAVSQRPVDADAAASLVQRIPRITAAAGIVVVPDVRQVGHRVVGALGIAVAGTRRPARRCRRWVTGRRRRAGIHARKHDVARLAVGSAWVDVLVDRWANAFLVVRFVVAAVRDRPRIAAAACVFTLTDADAVVCACFRVALRILATHYHFADPPVLRPARQPVDRFVFSARQVEPKVDAARIQFWVPRDRAGFRTVLGQYVPFTLVADE